MYIELELVNKSTVALRRGRACVDQHVDFCLTIFTHHMWYKVSTKTNTYTITTLLTSSQHSHPPFGYHHCLLYGLLSMVRSRHVEKTGHRSRTMEEIQKAALSGQEVDTHTSRTREEKAQDGGSSTMLMVSCFLGIFISYFIYGLLQEKM